MEKIFLILSISFLFVISCKQRINEDSTLTMNEVSYEKMKENSSCEKLMLTFGITHSNVNDFISNLKEENLVNEFNRLILLFYSQEGEVIQYKQYGVFINKEKEPTVASFSNLKFEKSISIKNFDSENLFKKLNINSNESTRRKVFVYDINSDNISCSSYFDIDFNISKELKTLTIFDSDSD